MAEALWHGRELDEAMAGAPAPPEMGIRLDALRERTKQFSDEQLADLTDPERLVEAKRILEAEGVPCDDETVKLLQLRSVIGGGFIYGLAVGLRLAGIPKREENQ